MAGGHLASTNPLVAAGRLPPTRPGNAVSREKPPRDRCSHRLWPLDDVRRVRRTVPMTPGETRGFTGISRVWTRSS